MSGTEGIRLLKERYPGLPALTLTVYEDDERIFDALCAGACGYLLKSTPPARLLESLQEAVAGGAPHVAAGGPAGDRVVPRVSPAGKIR
jgi:DNA-binding NarL/FixJ family response regulator